MTNRDRRRAVRSITALLAAVIVFLPAACAQKPDWAAKNEKLIAGQSLQVRTRGDIPAIRLKPSLADGIVTPAASLPESMQRD